MAEKKTVLTTSGAKKLEEELQNLKVVRRAEVAQKIKDARAQGDLSENAEYDSAKEEQGEIETRIEEIENILKNAEITEESTDTSRVYIGAVVTINDLEFNDQFDVTIVGSTEANSLENRISNESPLGSALLGAKKGAVVEVNAPGGILKYKVVKIKKR